MTGRPPPGAGPQMVKAFPLGDTGYALVGGGVSVDVSPETGDLVVAVVAVGGRPSEIMGLTPVQAVLHEIARVPVADVAAKLQAAEEKMAAEALAGMPRAAG